MNGEGLVGRQLEIFKEWQTDSQTRVGTWLSEQRKRMIAVGRHGRGLVSVYGADGSDHTEPTHKRQRDEDSI